MAQFVTAAYIEGTFRGLTKTGAFEDCRRNRTEHYLPVPQTSTCFTRSGAAHRLVERQFGSTNRAVLYGYLPSRFRLWTDWSRISIELLNIKLSLASFPWPVETNPRKLRSLNPTQLSPRLLAILLLRALRLLTLRHVTFEGQR